MRRRKWSTGSCFPPTAPYIKDPSSFFLFFLFFPRCGHLVRRFADGTYSRVWLILELSAILSEMIDSVNDSGFYSSLRLRLPSPNTTYVSSYNVQPMSPTAWESLNVIGTQGSEHASHVDHTIMSSTNETQGVSNIGRIQDAIVRHKILTFSQKVARLIWSAWRIPPRKFFSMLVMIPRIPAIRMDRRASISYQPLTMNQSHIGRRTIPYCTDIRG